MTPPPLRFLQIEDDLNNQEIAEYALQALGHVVVTEGTAAAGLARVHAQGEGYDVVLLDLQLPDLSGYEVARRFRAHPATRDWIIVAVTARASQADERMALQAGCDEVIRKPYKRRPFVDQLSACLRRRGRLGPDQALD